MISGHGAGDEQVHGQMDEGEQDMGCGRGVVVAQNKEEARRVNEVEEIAMH